MSLCRFPAPELMQPPERQSSPTPPHPLLSSEGPYVAGGSFFGPVVGIGTPCQAPWPIDPGPILDRSRSGGGHLCKAKKRTWVKLGPADGLQTDPWLKGCCLSPWRANDSSSAAIFRLIGRGKLPSSSRPVERPSVRSFFPLPVWLLAFVARGSRGFEEPDSG